MRWFLARPWGSHSELGSPARPEPTQSPLLLLERSGGAGEGMGTVLCLLDAPQVQHHPVEQDASFSNSNYQVVSPPRRSVIFAHTYVAICKVRLKTVKLFNRTITVFLENVRSLIYCSLEDRKWSYLISYFKQSRPEV